MTFTPWRRRAAALGSGLLLAAAFPPLNWWPLALVAMVPLLLAVWSKASAGDYADLGREGQHSVDPGGQNVRTPHAGPVPNERAEGASQEIEAQAFEDSDGDIAKESHGPEPRAPVFWPAFRLGWLFGFVFFTATLWWIQHVTLPGMLALTSYLALYPAVAMGIAGWLGMRRDERWGVALGKLLLLAGVWTGLEWLRGVALWGFPWNGLAVPLFDLPSATSLAEFTGLTGLAAAVILSNGVIALATITFSRKKARAIGLVCLGLLACFGLELAGIINIAFTQKVDREFRLPLRAVLVQPNVTMEEKMSPDPEVQRQRYFGLTEQTDAALAQQWPLPPELLDKNRDEERELFRPTFNPNAKPDLVVWPESAVPGFFNDMVQGGAFADQLKQGDFSLVTGADHEEWGKLYNSIAVMRGTTDNRTIHPKIRLVPFGEFIPFRKQVPLLESMLGGLIPMDFNAGTSLEPVRVKGQPFSIVPLVCFEDTIGEHARKFVRAEPQVIVNVTNDNWFRESPATEMHFVNARWRALELRRTLLRSANTGVTAIVSPWGDVQRIPSHQQGVVTGKFYTGHGEVTFYAKHGDIVSQVAGIIGVAGCAAVWWHRRRGPGDLAGTAPA